MNVIGVSSSSGCRLFKKGKKKKKNKVPSAGGHIMKSKSKPDQSQVECFYYRKQGHWKRNYPQYIAFLDPNRLKKKKK